MKSKLKIYTSFLEKNNLSSIIDNGLLPILVIRKVSNFPVIERYSNAPIHFRELAPSNELIGKFNKGIISFEEFEKLYVIELSKVSIQDIIKKLEYLSEHYNSKGIVLITPDKTDCYRKALSLVLNYSKTLTEPVVEYDIKH